MTRQGTITLSIDSQLECVALVGKAVEAICAATPLGAARAREAETAVVEAVNNAIEHAYGKERGHPVDVVVTVHADRITFAVCNSGRTMPRAPAGAATAGEQSPFGLTESGRGFLIMQSFADEVSYAEVQGRNVLTLVKRFDRR